MSNGNINISVSGIESVLRSLNDANIARDVDRITETYARKMANDSAGMAPRKSGALKNSITASVEKESDGIWTYGSDKPYATRQEYEHRTKKGFIRKSVWNNREPYRNKLRERIGEIGGDL